MKNCEEAVEFDVTCHQVQQDISSNLLQNSFQATDLCLGFVLGVCLWLVLAAGRWKPYNRWIVSKWICMFGQVWLQRTVWFGWSVSIQCRCVSRGSKYT